MMDSKAKAYKASAPGRTPVAPASPASVPVQTTPLSTGPVSRGEALLNTAVAAGVPQGEPRPVGDAPMGETRVTRPGYSRRLDWAGLEQSYPEDAPSIEDASMEHGPFDHGAFNPEDEPPLRIRSGAPAQPNFDLLQQLLAQTIVGHRAPTTDASMIVANHDTEIDTQIIVETLNITIQRLNLLGDDAMDKGQRDAMQARAASARDALTGEHPDYAAGAHNISDALRIAQAVALQIRVSFDEVTGSLAEQLQRPEQTRDAGVVTRLSSRAAILLTAGAALALIIADLTTTGGMITLASLSFGAGHTIALQRHTGVCPTCGAGFVA